MKASLAVASFAATAHAYSMETFMFLDDINGTCSAYQCQNGCDRCFNPDGRDGVMCPSTQQQGYYCPDQYNFACLDWAFGSKNMQKAEQAFNKRTNMNVKFGIGTYGENDEMRGIGKCFRMKHDGSDQELLVQSINTGGDVSGNQFDLMQGDGGTGAFNWCAGNDWSIYPGDNDAWGEVYGGWPTRDGCQKLPPYPQHKNSKYDYDNLIELCEYSFD